MSARPNGQVRARYNLRGPRPLGSSRITLRLEAGQRLGLILKGGDNVWQVDYPQHSPHPTTRTEQFQATALTAKGNIRLGDGADARTIQLCQVGQVQQQLPHPVGDQSLQMADKKIAVGANRRSSLKVQNSDIAGFPN